MRHKASNAAVVFMVFWVMSAAAARDAQAQGSFPPGRHVQASPIMMEGYWQDCVVVSGPDSYKAYRVKCGTGSEVTVPARWVRPAPATVAPGAGMDDASKGTAPAKAPVGREPVRAAAARGVAAGAIVLASPLQMASSWRRCEVRSGPGANGYYSLDCVDEYSAVDGRMKMTIRTVSVSGEWIKPNDPAFRPDMQLGVARAAAAIDAAPRPKAPTPPPNGAASSVALGAYECWAFNASRMNLNFRVTSAGRYTASDGSPGTFTFDPGSKAIQFTGYLAESMPAGFRSIYHEPKGIPTVSFRGRGGDEVSFCEKAR